MSLRVKYVKSAVLKTDYPLDRRPEVAIVGRSNAGKSSLINALAQKDIAKVSQQPGKTSTLNFFLCNEEFYLVDMPGYGFAKRSAKEKTLWKNMIEGYLSHRKNLKGLLLIMDIRRKWGLEEQMLAEWVAERGHPIFVILNKTDKAKQGERVKAQRLVGANEFVSMVFCVSSTQKKGLETLQENIYEQWLKEES
ncbi:MAG: YihA family ribosome biogenesis GTP-binding protein [Bdellovibrionaceae bacterium]|nr:YihA family ribosome biogenesis GTP-binding protein [Pseudobdellovibrionaceae bacterium]